MRYIKLKKQKKLLIFEYSRFLFVGYFFETLFTQTIADTNTYTFTLFQF